MRYLTGECTPSWGAKFALDDPVVLDPIKELIAQGAEMIVATGGALVFNKTINFLM